jgi:hypothetical protein
MPVEYGEPLSERELEIIALVAEGLTNREIAARTYLSPNTVKVHLRNMFSPRRSRFAHRPDVRAMQEGWIRRSGRADRTCGGRCRHPRTGRDKSDAAVVVTAAPAPPPPAPLRPWRGSAGGVAVGTLLAVGVLLLAGPHARPGAISFRPGDYLQRSPTQSIANNLPPAVKMAGKSYPPCRCAGRTGGGGCARAHLHRRGNDRGRPDGNQLDVLRQRFGRLGCRRPRARQRWRILAWWCWATSFCAGGCDANWRPVIDVHRYDIDQDAWDSVAFPLPEPLCAYALTNAGNRIYLFRRPGDRQCLSRRGLRLRFHP